MNDDPWAMGMSGARALPSLRQFEVTGHPLRRALRFILLATPDVVAFVLAVLAVQGLLHSVLGGALGAGSGGLLLSHDTVVSALLFLVMAVCLYHSGRYSVGTDAGPRGSYLPRYCALACLVHGAVILLLGFREGYMLAVWALLPTFAAGTRRLVWAAFRDSGLLSARTLLIGSPQAVGVVRDMLGDGTASGLDVVGTNGTAVPPGTSAGSAWHDLLVRHGAEMVVVAVQGHTDEQPMLRSLQKAGVPAAKMIALDGAGRPLRPQQMGSRIGLHPAEHALKSMVDFVSALLLLVLLSPALLLLAAVVKLDGGPILFRHERVGLRGRMFHCLKFRTMFPDGDKLLHDLLERDPEARREWNATQKLRRDPRVTPVGRFLRDTSMDELPQLLNVLQGEMSLVGPRPVVPVELPRYGTDIAYYLAATPGLTGLWQVSGRSDTSYERRVQLDIAYVRNWSFWTDIRILLQTFPVVLLRRGAV